MNNGEWAYFPEGGNNDFKFPQLISNPWPEDIPAFMETAFGAASIPSVSGQTENGYPWAVISTSSDDTALGFEIKISDNSGNELGKLQTTEKKVSLENYIPSQGIYKISVRALGGYNSFESAYSNEYVYDYSVSLPEELITVEPVYIAKDGEIYNYQNIAYNKFAVAAAQAEPVRFYEVTEYGMLINSEYDTDINNYLKKAVGSNIDKDGKFAILIHGGGIPHQKIYFIRPYAKYSGVNEGIVYGRTQIFILK